MILKYVAKFNILNYLFMRKNIPLLGISFQAVLIWQSGCRAVRWLASIVYININKEIRRVDQSLHSTVVGLILILILTQPILKTKAEQRDIFPCISETKADRWFYVQENVVQNVKLYNLF